MYAKLNQDREKIVKFHELEKAELKEEVQSDSLFLSSNFLTNIKS
jgi:hypothetical protein